MRSRITFLISAFLFLLVLAPVVASHSAGDSYSYKIYTKIDMRVKGGNLTDSSVPSRLILVVNGTTEFSIIRFSKDEVFLRLRPNLTISGEVEPSSLQQNLRELLNLLTVQMNRVYEVSVPLSVLGYAPYGGLEEFMQKNLGVSVSWPSDFLNITIARFTTWRGIPALQLRFVGNVTSTQYVLMSMHVEGESYLDSTTFLTLYSEGRAIYNISYSGITINYVIEVKSELININAVKDINSRAYGVKFEEGESRIYVASGDLSISSLNTVGNELSMRVSGTGLGGITIFTTQNVRVQKVFVDNTPASYQILRYSGGSIIKIPLTLSEHEVRITYEKTIKSVEEISVVQAGISASILVLALVIVPVAVLIVLLTYLLKRKKSY